MLRLAQGQGSAILQTPQALGGSAQQAPAAQGGVGVLTPPGQGGAVVSGQQNQGNGALPGQQTQSGPAALQPQQGQAMPQTPAGQTMPQGQQSGGAVPGAGQGTTPVIGNYIVWPHPDLPDDIADPYMAYRQYEQVLGEDMPDGGYSKFLQIRNAQGKEWRDLRKEYWCAGAVERIRQTIPDIVVFKKPGDITPEYLESARKLTQEQKNGIYHYSHYIEGIAMNEFLAGKPGASLTPEEMQYMKNFQSALDALELPHCTLTWRGTYTGLLGKIAKLDLNNPSSWKHAKLYINRICSTSILASTAYDKPVEMMIVVPGNMSGAGYIDEYSYNCAHEGQPDERGMVLTREHEVPLQFLSEFDIIEGTILDGRMIIVVRWLGGYHGKQK